MWKLAREPVRSSELKSQAPQLAWSFLGLGGLRDHVPEARGRLRAVMAGLPSELPLPPRLPGATGPRGFLFVGDRGASWCIGTEGLRSLSFPGSPCSPGLPGRPTRCLDFPVSSTASPLLLLKVSFLFLEGVGGRQREGLSAAWLAPWTTEQGPAQPADSVTAPTPAPVSVLPRRAALSASLCPTSGARRRTSCPQPRARRRPPRTSRCSRPRPPPPVSPSSTRSPPPRARCCQRSVPRGPGEARASGPAGHQRPPCPSLPACRCGQPRFLTGPRRSLQHARCPRRPGSWSS